MPLCQMKGCRNRSSRLLNKSMFSIPDPRKDRDRTEKWLLMLGNERLLPIETYETLHNKSRVVCEDHFEPDCFEEDMRAKIMGYKPRKKLKPDAVPTIRFVDGKKHSNKPSSSSERRKRKASKPCKLVNNGDCSEHISKETGEEFSIPPLFPSRLPLNDEEEEEDDKSNPDAYMKIDFESPHTDATSSIESTSQRYTIQEQEHDIGPYCKEAGISTADITSHFQNMLPLPTIKNGLVLEILDYLHEMQMFNLKVLIKDLKRLGNTPDLGDWSVGGYIKRLMERRDKVERNTESGEKNLKYLHEEESVLTRPKIVHKKSYIPPRTKSLHKNLQLAEKQREETWKCLDSLEKDMQRLKQQNNLLSKRVTELTTENKDLRNMVGHLQEQCHELEQFKVKYKALEEKCKQHTEIDMV